jgi:hypothetical protein
MQIARAQTPVRVAAEFTREHCDQLQSTIKNMELALQDNTGELKAVQAQIELAQSGSAANVDKMVSQSLAEVRSLRKRLAAERNINIEMRRYEDWQRLVRRDEEALKTAESRLDFWTERETAALSGGAVTVKGPPQFLDELKSREIELFESRAQLHAKIVDSLKESEAGNCSEVARRNEGGASAGTATWSGTWTFVGVNGGALILQQTGSLVQGHLNVRGQNYPTFTLKVSGATATGVADVSGGLGTLGNLTLTIFGRRFTGKYLAGGRSYEPDGYCTAGDCLKNR